MILNTHYVVFGVRPRLILSGATPDAASCGSCLSDGRCISSLTMLPAIIHCPRLPLAPPACETSPISRLVSAYFYCHKVPGDQLCGKHILDVASVDLLTFAEHWGNYGVRQFALAFVRPEDVAASKVGAEIDVCSDFSPEGVIKKSCPAWYRLKRYVERQSTCTRSGVDTGGQDVDLTGGACASGPESWMMQFLKPIEDILNTKYAAVGLLEEWETTLLLFNAALEIPGFDWPAGFAGNGRTNAYSPSILKDGRSPPNVKEETLRRAWVDPDLKAVLWLDILLYDHAVAIFKKQAAEHGLL